MQNERTDLPSPEKRTAKSCCLLALAVGLGCFLLVLTALAGIIIADTIQLRGEGLTLERRAERYKVAVQFIWVDFTRWVSGRFSDAPPPENEPPPENDPPAEDAHSF